MNPQKIREQVKNNEAILLDVREDYEWNDGHILNAKHIPLGNLDETTTKDFSKDLPVYIYCRSGGRASVAESVLIDLGFDKAKNIGGVTNWQDEGGELVK